MERFKTVLLISLIFLSMLLTYRLWFAQFPLKEETLPRYEEAYFTPPPSLQEVIKPEEIYLYNEDVYLLRRGENEHGRLWETCLTLIQQNLAAMEELKRESEEAWGSALRGDEFQLKLRFNPPFPLESLSREMEAVLFPMEVEEALLIWDGPEDRRAELFLRQGEDIFSSSLILQEELAQELTTREGKEHKVLEAGSEAVLAAREDIEDDIEEDKDEGDIILGVIEPGEEDLKSISGETLKQLEIANDSVDEEHEQEDEPGSRGENEEQRDEEEESDEKINDEEKEYKYQWDILVADKIYIPRGEIKAAEMELKPEELPQEELVRAFFLDPSMASRIEERDGASYYTDGERGVRIYPQGLLEYTAPALERNAANINYINALIRGVENKSLFGGWLPSSYLTCVERDERGFSLKWEIIQDGMPLKGMENGNEMLLNERGVYYYRRNFLLFREELGEKRPFRPIEDALYAVVEAKEEEFSPRYASLLSIEQAYYLKEEEGKAVPAWEIEFEETGKIYLHWQTLEFLE